MVSSVSSVPPVAHSDNRVCGPWRDALAVAGLSFALFLFGAGVMMALFDLLGFWAPTLAAGINLTAMLPICALTALALEGGAMAESYRSRKMRVGQRTLKVASLYWAAGGVALLISLVLLFVAQF
jgi:hypothetical protein